MKGSRIATLVMVLGLSNIGFAEGVYRLAGIIGSNDFKAALIEDDTGRQKVLRVGDRLGNDRLVELTAEWAVLIGPKGEYTLNLAPLPSEDRPLPAISAVGSELLPEVFWKLTQLEREIADLEPEAIRRRFNAAAGLSESAQVLGVDNRSFQSLGEMLRYVNTVLSEEGGVVRLELSGDRYDEVYLKIDRDD